jgi:hypothetical protein
VGFGGSEPQLELPTPPTDWLAFGCESAARIVVQPKSLVTQWLPADAVLFEQLVAQPQLVSIDASCLRDEQPLQGETGGQVDRSSVSESLPELLLVRRDRVCGSHAHALARPRISLGGQSTCQLVDVHRLNVAQLNHRLLTVLLMFNPHSEASQKVFEVASILLTTLLKTVPGQVTGGQTCPKIDLELLEARTGLGLGAVEISQQSFHGGDLGVELAQQLATVVRQRLRAWFGHDEARLPQTWERGPSTARAQSPVTA